MRGISIAVSAIVSLAALAGCSSSGSTAAGPSSGAGSSGATAPASASSGDGAAITGVITVDAAASLTEAFTTLKAQFEQAHPGVHVTITFGASSDLSTQISQGAPVDVFASASTKNMTALGTAAPSPTTFASNTLEIATPPSNPAKISTVADLAKPGVKVAVCDPAVPCGVVAATVFANAKVRVTPVAREADVKSTLATVESGEVDAGLVYVTDVRSAGSKVHGVPIPSGIDASTKYPIAALSSAKNPAGAKAFVDYVLSAAGTKVLLADGFTGA